MCFFKYFSFIKYIKRNTAVINQVKGRANGKILPAQMMNVEEEIVSQAREAAAGHMKKTILNRSKDGR